MRRLAPLIAIAVVVGALTTVAPSAGGATNGGGAAAGTGFTAVAAGKSPQGRARPPRRQTQEAVFNVPNPWGTKAQNYNIVSRIAQAIRGVPGPTKYHPNPTITIATYLMDHTASVTAMIEACQRGVDIRVVLDDDIVNRNSRRLISALNGDNIHDTDGDGKADSKPKTGPCGRKLRKKRDRDGDKRGWGYAQRQLVDEDPVLMSRTQARASLDQPITASRTWGKDGSYVKVCDGGCRNAGSGGNMHSKFYLFSKTGKSRNVVMISSSNINRGGAKLGWNDMYIMRERPESYKYYLMVHRALTKEVRANNQTEYIVDGPITSRFFPIRKGGKRNDPTLRDLKNVRCTSAFGPTEIHISMFFWKGSRGNYLVDRLLDLAHNGCRVSIIYGAPSRQIAERLRNAAGAGRINLYDSRWDMDLDGYVDVRTHAKYLLVKGTYKDDSSAFLVSTGSQNWVNGSLSLGDETSVNINLKSAYQAYRHNWDVIRAHSRRLPYA